MNQDDELNRLSRDIDRLKIEYERFFGGFLQMPPDASRQRLNGRLRAMRSQPPRRFAERFRLNSLEARFNAMCELMDRRLRDRERSAARSTRIRREEPTVVYDPVEGVVMTDSPDEEAARALYRALYQGGDDTAPSDFDRFSALLQGQIIDIRQRTGCEEIRFRVESQGGRRTLKAKPSARQSSGAAGQGET